MNALLDELHTIYLNGGFSGFANHLRIGVQLAIVAYGMFWVWRKIRGTQAERLVNGVLVLLMIYMLCHLLQLTLITAILKELIPVIVVTLLIVFQPELRRGLGYLGRTNFFRFDFSITSTEDKSAHLTIEQIIQAVSSLARSKTGALIVVEPPEGERDYISPGTTLNANVSANLILSLFNITSPLHDGAVVIRQNKIVAAGVILPMTENPKLNHRYGTRHRAALGLSETYDGLCIIVSEETGAISAANRGMLVRYTAAEDLADALMYMYHQVPQARTQGPLTFFLGLFGLSNKEQTASPETEPAGAGPPESTDSNQAPPETSIHGRYSDSGSAKVYAISHKLLPGTDPAESTIVAGNDTETGKAEISEQDSHTQRQSSSEDFSINPNSSLDITGEFPKA